MSAPDISIDPHAVRYEGDRHQWAALMERVDHYRTATLLADPCAYCGARFVTRMGLDHIVPRALVAGLIERGEMAAGLARYNKAAACSTCNQRKQTVPLVLYLAARRNLDWYSRVVEVAKVRTREAAEVRKQTWRRPSSRYCKVHGTRRHKGVCQTCYWEERRSEAMKDSLGEAP